MKAKEYPYRRNKIVAGYSFRMNMNHCINQRNRLLRNWPKMICNEKVVIREIFAFKKGKLHSRMSWRLTEFFPKKELTRQGIDLRTYGMLSERLTLTLTLLVRFSEQFIVKINVFL